MVKTVVFKHTKLFVLGEHNRQVTNPPRAEGSVFTLAFSILLPLLSGQVPNSADSVLVNERVKGHWHDPSG